MYFSLLEINNEFAKLTAKVDGLESQLSPETFLPSQSGNAGKVLSTDGMYPEWVVYEGGGGEGGVIDDYPEEGNDFAVSSNGVAQALNLKVDKDGSKVLSDVNFTSAKDSKLSGIQTGATANQSDTILKTRSNHLGTQPASSITEDTTHRFVSDDEKTTWNAKASSSHTHTLDNLSDVTLTSPANGQVIKYLNGTWVNGIDELAEAGEGAISWGNITGTIGSQTDLQSALIAAKDRANHTNTQAQSTITNLSTDLAAKAPLASPTFTGTVSGITKGMVALGNVDNTSDVNKPVSTAQQTALNLKSNLVSPTFTGTPTLPTGTIGVTQTAGNSTTALATTAFVTSADALKANTASPTFTGTVVLPSTTSIGNISSTELGYLDGVTSSIQTQLNTKLIVSNYVKEIPTGLKNGVNKIYTLPSTPITGTDDVFRDGILQKAADYTLSGNQITVTDALTSTEELVARYFKQS